MKTSRSTHSRDELARDISRAIMRWQDATQKFDEAIGKLLNLNTAEGRALSFIANEPRPASEIASAVGLTKAATTALIDRLESRGLVQRQRTSADRRQVHVAMTEAARTSTLKFYGPIADEGARILSGMSAAELKTVLRFVEAAVKLQERHIERVQDMGGATVTFSNG